ncbi:MAG TPA: hypothetical protein VG734_04615 [Lacunisphaera sp.]|nr:hypothetical protein [Lacunisphaera sp.]
MPEETPAPAAASNPAPEPPPGFTLPLSAWLAWGLCTALFVLHALSYQNNPTPYQQGGMIGQAIVLFLVPSVVAWIVWRASGRSTRAGRNGFLITLGLVALNQIPEALREAHRYHNADVIAELARESKTDLRASLERDGVVSGEAAGRILDKASKTFAEQVAANTGEDREIALCMQEFMSRGSAVRQRQLAAVKAADMSTFFDLDSLATASLRSARRDALRQLQESNAALREYLEQGSSWVEAELTRRQVSPDRIRKMMAGYAAGAARNMPTALAIRGTDEDLVGLMLDFLAFAEEFEGKWSKDAKSGDLVLPTNAASERYNNLIKQVNDVSQKQLELQKTLLAPRPAGN